MLPIPQASTTLTNTLETSQPVFDAFKPYAYMEIGLIIGALAIVFIIAIFRDAIASLLHRTAETKFDTKQK